MKRIRALLRHNTQGVNTVKKPNPSQYLTVTDLAQRWQVSACSIRRLIWSKQLKSLRVGRTVRVPETEVERYEDAQMQD